MAEGHLWKIPKKMLVGKQRKGRAKRNGESMGFKFVSPTSSTKSGSNVKSKMPQQATKKWSMKTTGNKIVEEEICRSRTKHRREICTNEHQTSEQGDDKNSLSISCFGVAVALLVLCFAFVCSPRFSACLSLCCHLRVCDYLIWRAVFFTFHSYGFPIGSLGC